MRKTGIYQGIVYLLILLFLATGCARPVHQFRTITLHPSVSEEHLVRTMQYQLRKTKWTLEKRGPGNYDVTYKDRKRRLVLSMTLQTGLVKFAYKESLNLKHNPRKNSIHRRGVVWMRGLEKQFAKIVKIATRTVGQNGAVVSAPIPQVSMPQPMPQSNQSPASLDEVLGNFVTNLKVNHHGDLQGNKIMIEIKNKQSGQKDSLATQIESSLYNQLKSKLRGVKVLDPSFNVSGLKGKRIIMIQGSYMIFGKNIFLSLKALKGVGTGEIIAQDQRAIKFL